ncbi:hypothetical protein AVEN_94676-1 [Araneus ventricosus]|uniref:Uncharacterized protein n=1 Tax=Araneus ventricosus TaxID=182803 RepID=A0A4Y2QPM7_ARAVE|nr:hypothetical protein AVEN_94676-1 [Araneus ventricosus]
MIKQAIFTYLTIRTCAETEISSAHCYVAGLWADPVDHSRRDAGPFSPEPPSIALRRKERNKFASFAAALKPLLRITRTYPGVLTPREQLVDYPTSFRSKIRQRGGVLHISHVPYRTMQIFCLIESTSSSLNVCSEALPVCCSYN